MFFVINLFDRLSAKKPFTSAKYRKVQFEFDLFELKLKILFGSEGIKNICQPLSQR